MNKDKYLVLGNPIAHSKSPAIHAQFAEQTGEPIEYDRRLVEVGEFEPAVRAMQEEGIAGVNVTVPFKEDAFRISDELSPRAAKAGAVNTLMFREDGSILGDNTDGAGMVRDIVENNGQQIQGKRVLILGAGGAVRGVLKPLIDQGPESVTIANRTVAKAEQLHDLFVGEYEISVSDFESLAGNQFDVIINGTSLGLSGQVAPVPNSVLTDDAIAYDMMYGPGSQPFQEWATGQGAVLALDGLGMLVEQAAESFYLWRGVRPDTAAVIKSLRDSSG